MLELLKLVGFSRDEIEKEKHRFERTFQILQLTSEDIDRACERVNRLFPLELEGCRELLCLHMLTLNDLVLAREEGKEKIIYADWPIPVTLLAAAKMASPQSLITTPGQILNVNMGQIFDKLSPIIAEAEELGQAPGQAHCPLYQTHVGAIVKGIIPMPDLEIVSGFHCEPPGAALELLNDMYSIRLAQLDGCYDSQWGAWPSPDCNMRELEYFGKQVEECLEEVYEVLGNSISEEIEHQAVSHYGKLFYTFQLLLETFAKAEVQPFSHSCVCLMTWLFNTPLTQEQYKRATNALESLFLEAQRRSEKGEGISPKGSPRVGYGLIIAVDPSVVRMIEEAGVNVCNCFWPLLPPSARYKARNKTFGERVAGQVRRVGGLVNSKAIVDTYMEYVQHYKWDGFIMQYSVSCRPYAMAAQMIKHALQNETGIPVMLLEGDFYDTRNYSSEQVRTRVETFVQMLRSRMERKKGLNG